MDQDFKHYLLNVTGSSDCEEIETIQSLWSGYGHIVRYQLKEGVANTVVVKCIAPEDAQEHPRGWNSSIGHKRKVRSYEVEKKWYELWGTNCLDDCRIPKFIGSYPKGHKQWIILEDLNPIFPVRKQELTLDEIKVCLKWLASFHATFLLQQPIDLWEVGTYWHLKTRLEEYEKIENNHLKSKAYLIDDALNHCTFQTIVHGDAKLANFCFSEDGKRVAAVDFQYVGGGCGMKDIAYFLGSCLASDALKSLEKHLLDDYFFQLSEALKARNSSVDVIALEAEWRGMYPIACADFTRFLLGWMPEHQKINRYQLEILDTVLANL